MIAKLSDRLLRPIAKHWRQDKSMKRFGIARLRKWAKRYNRWRYADRVRLHHDAFTNDSPRLLQENGAPATWPPRIQLKDGWARDDSLTLPHMQEVLEQAG